MNVLLVYPVFPQSFWSFDETIKLLGRKAMLPPLGLVTVAAMLPEEWEFKLVDRNIREATEEEWAWADMVMLSAMIVQKSDLHGQIREAKRRGKPVVIGGPYPTALPHECENVGADKARRWGWSPWRPCCPRNGNSNSSTATSAK